MQLRNFSKSSSFLPPLKVERWKLPIGIRASQFNYQEVKQLDFQVNQTPRGVTRLAKVGRHGRGDGQVRERVLWEGKYQELWLVLYLHWNFQQIYLLAIFTANIREKSPSSKQCRDSNPRPLERESLPITTRPGNNVTAKSFTEHWPCRFNGSRARRQKKNNSQRKGDWFVLA